ncbi:hypothetical protein L1987_78288 [Smallanthus sonchifolius]|uniref:Uncharacterized protein n=1 Tax=Smallanthus sonchifolius TaxID=185202 RepID=A0ACB8ZCF2_9ASTR|nr:hypothetical protein L1987_78288 [Smallanthus sonchifolius]
MLMGLHISNNLKVALFKKAKARYENAAFKVVNLVSVDFYCISSDAYGTKRLIPDADVWKHLLNHPPPNHCHPFRGSKRPGLRKFSNIVNPIPSPFLPNPPVSPFLTPNNNSHHLHLQSSSTIQVCRYAFLRCLRCAILRIDHTLCDDGEAEPVSEG